MIYTSYFAKYKGNNGVSIANVTPEWSQVKEKYPELYPSWENVKCLHDGVITKKEFSKRYIKQLKRLDVDVYGKLLQGKVLCCFEAPDKFCHRRVVAEWLRRGGYPCKELEYESSNKALTCHWCKYLQDNDREPFCKKTGEIFTDKEQFVHTCEDWRYAF